MRAPKGQKAAPKPGRRAAARAASGPTTQLDDLPDSVLGLIFSLARDSCGPNISAVSRRWHRVWFSEPAVWREFLLRPALPPEAALRRQAFNKEDWPHDSDEDLSDLQSEAEAEAAGDWWDGASDEQLAAAFAARRRELDRTAHLVTHAHLPYSGSLFRDQAERRGGWKLRQVVQALPAGLEGLTLDAWMGSVISLQESAALASATSAALSRFRSLIALQLRVQMLPKTAAAALTRLTGLSQLRLEVEQLGEDVLDSCLVLSALTSLTLCVHLHGRLPAQRLPELPQRLPLLVQLELSERSLMQDRLEDAQLPAPADFPQLRTYSYGYEFCRRRFQVGGVPLALCSYLEERQAGGGLPLWRRRMDARGSRHGAVQPPSGPPQARLKLHRAALPAGSTLQQLLGRLLPPCGISLGALELKECECTPAQCSGCPLLQGLNELAIKAPQFLPDGYSAADGSPTDPASRAAAEPALAALMAQMPRLERLELAVPLPAGHTLPYCIVQRSGLRSLDLDGSCALDELPAGPYLESLETLILDDQDFKRLPRALAAATRCRYLSLNQCYDMRITKKDVDNILVKMAALEELHINNDEDWNPYSYPIRLLHYMHERLPGVRIVNMAAELGGSGLPDSDGSEEDWESSGSEGGGGSEPESSEGGGSGWDSGGGGSGWGGYYLGSEEEEEEEEEQQPVGSSGNAGASSSRQPRAKPKPAAKARPAAKGSRAAAAAKGKGKQPAKGKAAAAVKPVAKAKGKGAQDKGKQQQKRQPARNRKGGK